MEGYIVSTINTSTSGIQNYWQVNNNKLEQTWKTSKETSIQQDKTDITSAKTDELDEANLPVKGKAVLYDGRSGEKFDHST